jgi:hypothetical protein
MQGVGSAGVVAQPFDEWARAQHIADAISGGWLRRRP